ncbi:hypothetical protein ACWGDE_23655 [Streptomyces sp. NPDC054956]
MALAVVFGVVLCGVALFGIRSMGDPYPSLFGVRVDGGRIAIKVPLCPGQKVVSVRVRDFDGRKTLWKASAPATPEVLRGEVTLWRSEDFLKSGGGQQPAKLAEAYEVTVEVLLPGEEGTSDDVTATVWVPKEQSEAWTYVTADGRRTTQEPDIPATDCTP